jgi:hypothetical protein
MLSRVQLFMPSSTTMSVSAGRGVGSLSSWVVAGVVIALLGVVAWWATRSSRRGGRP